LNELRELLLGDWASILLKMNHSNAEIRNYNGRMDSQGRIYWVWRTGTLCATTAYGIITLGFF
jgi:hypothetical protein